MRLAVMKALTDSEDLESKDGDIPPDAPRWSILMCTLTFTPPATLDPPPRTAVAVGLLPWQFVPLSWRVRPGQSC